MRRHYYTCTARLSDLNWTMVRLYTLCSQVISSNVCSSTESCSSPMPWGILNIPASSLHVDANEMPLELRRRKLAAQYCLKVSADTSNPAVDCIFNKLSILSHRDVSSAKTACWSYWTFSLVSSLARRLASLPFMRLYPYCNVVHLLLECPLYTVVRGKYFFQFCL